MYTLNLINISMHYFTLTQCQAFCLLEPLAWIWRALNLVLLL